MSVEHDLQQRWGRRTRDPSFYALLLVGAGLVVAPLLPGKPGEWTQGGMGLRLVQFLLGFGLIYLGVLVHDVRGLRERNLVLLETMLAAFREHQVARRDQEAVEILLVAMSADSEATRGVARRQLARLTGQDFGDEAEAWNRWWNEHRESWAGRVSGQELP